ncbi:helix-turn-helix transcriptional regulator [Pseudomonas chlororaphis]|uniref:AraC family transcriptional regulator n=1 Tax=Pseudomonas chlororaphis TaxID=587753 RepID=UPI00209AB180|nr:helix-turn-helix transcriptional regulator [Pseudomonas chlororaphis]MCO7613259.1 helix-turn-helix transcriptional regulator [Pseudomonas chlororaphis]
MRNISIDSLDQTPRPVVAIGTDYADGQHLPRHSHRRAQLLYGATGVMQVGTAQGNWVVPPQRAVWIPPGVEHEVLMLGVSTRSLYIEPGAAPLDSHDCRVVGISPLLRQLLLEAVDMPLEYDQHGRDGLLVGLLLHEIQRCPRLPLHIPLPANGPLLELCRAFLAHPNVHQSPQQWADRLHISLRTFNRWFRQETDMSFVQWRQRACVIQALARLASAEPVTRIALDLGYDSPGAFSTMFRRVLGQSPSTYLNQQAAFPGKTL